MALRSPDSSLCVRVYLAATWKIFHILLLIFSQIFALFHVLDGPISLGWLEIPELHTLAHARW